MDANTSLKVCEYECECGCGEIVKPGNRFLQGHNGRISTTRPTQLCECGCGEETTLYYGNPRKFIHGHNGRVCSDVTRAKLSTAGMGRVVSEKTRAKIGYANKGNLPRSKDQPPWNKGKKHSEEHIRNSVIARTIKRGPRAKGYCDAWSEEYRDDLRKCGCEHCGITSMMDIHLTGQKLTVHHANGKKNCAPWEIVTLCCSCHSKLHQKKYRNERERV